MRSNSVPTRFTNDPLRSAIQALEAGATPAAVESALRHAFTTCTAKDGVRPLAVTPMLAKAFLAHNLHNRPLRDRRVAYYSGCMRRGEFIYTHDAIRFATTGALLDGQNRLAACIDAGVTVGMGIGFGLSPDAFAYIDGGAKRSNCDALSVAGLANAKNLAAIAQLLHQYERNPASFGATISSCDGLTTFEVVDFVNAHPGLADAVSVGSRMNGALCISPRFGGCVYYLCRRADPERAKRLFDGLITGAMLAETSPEFQLRRMFAAASPDRSIRGRRERATYGSVSHIDLDRHLAARLVKVWNLVRRGAWTGARVPHWRTAKNPNESFPEVE